MSKHQFTPTHYFSTLGSHPPVLRIADGDTVATTTLDAGGFDLHRERRHKGVNPMTGPFYVEGAEPGDTLAVRLDRLRPNRRFGWSGVQLASNVMDPADVALLPPPPGFAEGSGEWDVDWDAGIAVLTSPATKLARLPIPIRPMVGCFGVAPSGGQAISTATSSTNGGNMDYKGFTEGVTVYFPVAVSGALFFIGDGHAVQGCGEVCGTGIEISFDVEFTLSVIKGKSIEWPRAETATHIVAAGNARPLDQALQHATSEMARWLQEEYALTWTEAHTLMGQCVEYEIANVFDPAYTVVCKMDKALLARVANL
ncbi:amidase [Capsulimonas corticalis]|uniref:Amidase n=1 Tax=Capsulimonas corticalis TaxID=2219043 RepID=A0A402D1K7_9BACT|nr:acetamidase/formamidase family protein [Capsulimonas corticalis]BDI28651.1 amidase [Capsulimonas corticalis]